MKRRANGEGSWHDCGNGSYRLRVYYDDIGYKDFYGTSQPLCIKKKEEFEALKKQGFDMTDNAPDFDVFSRMWMKNIKMKQLKAGSYDRLETTFEKHLIPVLENTKLNKIDDMIIQTDIINKMQDDGLSYSTIKKAYDGLNAVFKYAIAKKKMVNNPMELVVMPNKDLFETKDIVYWSKDERDKFLDACMNVYTTGNRRYSFSSLFIFCLRTGTRIGEALSLRHDEVYPTTHTALIDSTIVMTKDRKTNKSILIDQQATKRNKSRIIFVPDAAMDAVEDAKKQLGWEPHGYVFHTENNGPIRIDTATKTFCQILAHAGLSHCGTHTLRHTFVSLALQNNIPLVAISEQIGHANVAITTRVYAHLLEEARVASRSIFNIMQ